MVEYDITSRICENVKKSADASIALKQARQGEYGRTLYIQYIIETIEATKTLGSDFTASRQYRESTVGVRDSKMTRAELARQEAQDGYPNTSASHLYRDDKLSVEEKAAILAEAFSQSSKRKALLADHHSSPQLKRLYEDSARDMQKTAKRLTQAAKKVKSF